MTPRTTREAEVPALGVLGVGNMGGAIVRGVCAAGLVPAERIAVCDVDPARGRTLQDDCGVTVAPDAAALAAAGDLLVVAVKPQGARAALDDLAPHVNVSRHCVVSIMAGVPTSTLAARLPAGARVVRVMPNTPALVGEGMTAISGSATATAEDLVHVEKLFCTVGRTVRVDERHMDAVTAVSGSGPAYLFLVAECLAQAAADVGLPAPAIEPLVRQTLLGAATLLSRSDESAATLRERVTSPGGTTEAALRILAERGFAAAWSDAVAAATRRGAELAALA